MNDRAAHPWENHNDSCECHIGVCGDCGCTNEAAAPQPLDVERLAHAIHDERANRRGGCGNHTESWDDHIDTHRWEAEAIAGTYARLGSQEGSATDG